MIAVVEKENDLAADLLLEPAGRDHLCKEKALREKAARLLAETDDRPAHDGRDGALRRPAMCRRKIKPSGRRSAASLPDLVSGRLIISKESRLQKP
jgi:hypothetical protein